MFYDDYYLMIQESKFRIVYSRLLAEDQAPGAWLDVMNNLSVGVLLEALDASYLFDAETFQVPIGPVVILRQASAVFPESAGGLVCVP